MQELIRKWYSSLPSVEVMLNDFAGVNKLYIACGYTDLRRGIMVSSASSSRSLDCWHHSNRIRTVWDITDTLRVGAVSVSIYEGSSAKLL